jgi:hypothetical protein
LCANGPRLIAVPTSRGAVTALPSYLPASCYETAGAPQTWRAKETRCRAVHCLGQVLSLLATLCHIICLILGFLDFVVSAAVLCTFCGGGKVYVPRCYYGTASERLMNFNKDLTRDGIVPTSLRLHQAVCKYIALIYRVVHDSGLRIMPNSQTNILRVLSLLLPIRVGWGSIARTACACSTLLSLVLISVEARMSLLILCLCS